MHVGLKGEGQALLLARWDLDSILLSSQVADDAGTANVKVRCPETAANELDSDGLGLFIAKGEAGICRLAVDELDAEDLRVWKGGGDIDIQVRRSAGSVDFLIGYLCYVSDRMVEGHPVHTVWSDWPNS